MCPDDEPISLTFDPDDALTDVRGHAATGRTRTAAAGEQVDEQTLSVVRSLGPHEISCHCEEAGNAELGGHAPGCPRRQLHEMLTYLERRTPRRPTDRPTGSSDRDQEALSDHHADERVRHLVEITAEGFQLLDTETGALRADILGSRRQAQEVCDELNGAAVPARDRGPR